MATLGSTLFPPPPGDKSPAEVSHALILGMVVERLPHAVRTRGTERTDTQLCTSINKKLLHVHVCLHYNFKCALCSFGENILGFFFFDTFILCRYKVYKQTDLKGQHNVILFYFDRNMWRTLPPF